MRLLVGTLAVFAAAAQPVSVGLKAGATLTGDIDSFFATSESKRVTFGPMAVVAIGRGFSFEVDALYQRAGYRVQDSFLSLASTFTRARGNSFEFPLLLRRRVGRGFYAAAGYAPRVINGSEDETLVQAKFLDPPVYETLHFHNPGEWRTTHGVVAAAGVERRAGRLRIGPEIRYTYWTAPALDISGSRGFSIRSPQHRIQVFLEARFP